MPAVEEFLSNPESREKIINSWELMKQGTTDAANNMIQDMQKLPAEGVYPVEQKIDLSIEPVKIFISEPTNAYIEPVKIYTEPVKTDTTIITR